MHTSYRNFMSRRIYKFWNENEADPALPIPWLNMRVHEVWLLWDLNSGYQADHFFISKDPLGHLTDEFAYYRRFHGSTVCRWSHSNQTYVKRDPIPGII